MGEAKRRRNAGTYPTPTDPLTIARRFWCGRDPGNASDFVVPEGIVAITLDVEGAPPSTCMIDAARAADVEASVKRQMSQPGTPGYGPLIRALAQEFLEARRNGDDHMLKGIGLIALWTALNHPEAGSAMRQQTSDALRREGKAHITWRYSSQHGFAVALAPKFVDLQTIAALAPKDRVTVAGVNLDNSIAPQH